MYQLEDVTDLYSADHVTELGTVNKDSASRFRMNEIYLMNGLDDFHTEASEIALLDGFSKKPITIKPSERPRIGSGKAMDSRRRRRGHGLGNYPQDIRSSNFGFGLEVSESFPFIKPDEELSTTIAVVGGAFLLYLLWTPITGIIKGGLGVVEKVMDVRAAKRRGDSYKVN